VKVRFLAKDGAVTEAEAHAGERLLVVAQRADQPLEGACGGDMACATCHVVVAAEDFPRLTPASADEEDLLDLVPGATRTSRLACQIVLSEALDGMAVRAVG
jgi:ferredoxin